MAEVIGSLRVDRVSCTPVSLDHGVLLVGGEGSMLTASSTEFLAKDSQQWKAGPKLPVSLIYPCTVPITTSSFLAIGGLFSSRMVAELEMDESNQTHWKQTQNWNPLSEDRMFHACAKIMKTNQVLIAGGVTDMNENEKHKLLCLLILIREL